MSLDPTRSPRKLIVPLLLLAVLAFAAGPATAQVPPHWDHYKVYQVESAVLHPTVVNLRDQFTFSAHQVHAMEWFANPVEKNHAGILYPITRPELHYAWWRIDPLPFSIDIIASNQFGDHPLHVGDARYLLNPATKNAPAGSPIPPANHYKCYSCIGQPLTAPLILTDQFNQRTASQLIPVFFCTPVEKKTSSGQVYPILDPEQHYVVYDIGPGPGAYPAHVVDQFVDTQILMTADRFLMVPTRKHFPPTEAKSSTWGRLKQLYR